MSIKNPLCEPSPTPRSDSRGQRASVPYHGAAFTLIELLVVMAVIAILVSLLLPAMSMIQRQAGAVACLSNLRQISAAQLGYTTDHSGFLAPMHKANGTPIEEEAWGMWFGFLFKYDPTLRGNPVFMCTAPGRRTQVLKQVTWDKANSTDWANSMRFHSTSYAINHWAQELMGGDDWTRRISRALSPSAMIWMGEVIGCDPDGELHGEGGMSAPAPIVAPMYYAVTPGTYHTPTYPAMYTSVIGPYELPAGVWFPRYLTRFSHAKRMTCSFYDGHVAGVTLGEMVGDGTISNLWYGFR